ncbi:NAD(P)-dependent dehydrogenase (short-subunit alcohol dehydrogenase family) [Variovorax boronicumulans]|uniref:SDR family oxidoreductase n=1 Tax=Variovorax boronicumulans TaxID=436515 RepID=UPI002786C18A|nr:NAD(P)-dependent dehydrogenase (short-subunit alcohol dehydrogenase family) [Variovorax boronicumulans]
MPNPLTVHPRPPFSTPQQTPPGLESAMEPRPDFGETSYMGTGKLVGKSALITGGDSGIGRAVALAFAREGADVLISYLPEEESDARVTAQLIEREGRICLAVPGDICEEAHCIELVDKAMECFGRLDVLVNNAAFQMTHKDLAEISAEELDRTFRTNVHANFFLCKAAVVHMKPGSAIISTASVNADKPNATLVAYAATKGAIQNMTGGMAQLLAEKGIRVNCVAPGPFWTPLIPSTMPPEKVREFGMQTPMKRPGQPSELQAVYVLLASDQASYISGATIPVTGGVPFI